ncbi:MAG: hypothetical protein KDA44_03205 [Planctomycetales bacterium]|nr:hypothetical protein [Planctomycetales bacterium]
MTAITIDAATAAKLAAVTGEVQLCDETGRVIGSYVPKRPPTIEEAMAAGGLTWEEAERRVQETLELHRRGELKTKPLREIWDDLERRNDGTSQ